jgi:RNase P protein component
MQRRPIAANDWLMVYAQPAVSENTGSALGFIIPKKVLRKAVQRNKVRRWCRTYWQARPLPVPHHLLVRCRGKPRWETLAERKERYGALVQLFDQAFRALEHATQ